MSQTRANDMLIEMITPKVKEIEEKFSRGEALRQEDINTLLLKSQFNHINHLDQKLDEVTADCAKLRLDFEVRFAALETKFEQAQVKMQQTIITTMRWYIGSAALVITVLKAMDLLMK